jgi:Spy/CpxP family protein refolding chaperone
MKSLKFAAIAAVVTIVAGTAAPVGWAQEMESELPADQQLQEEIDAQPGTPEDLIRQVFDITDEQATAIRGIFAEYQSPIETATSEYLRSLSTLNDLLAPQVSSAAIRQSREDVLAKERTVYDLLFERNIAVREILTLEQRTEINAYLRSLLDLEPAEPIAAFPDNLIGLNADEAIAQLEADSWILTTQTPGTLFFDKDGQRLDLDLDPDGNVQNVFLR